MFRNIFPTFSSKIVGDGGDTPIFVWNLWWAKKALIDLKINPLHTDYLFYPSGTSLVFHTLTLTSGVFSIVFQYFMSLTQTFNLLFLMNFVASGILTFWVLRKMKMDYIGSAFGGLVFALAPPIVAQTIGHTNLYSVWFIPAILLATIYFLEKNPDKIDWSFLSENPAAIHLLEKNPDKINWYMLSSNPAIFEIDIKEYKEKILHLYTKGDYNFYI